MNDRVILHLDGQGQNHEAKNLRAVNARCTTCNVFIKPDRLRWFARRGIRITSCDLCSFQKRAERSQATQ